MLHVSDRERRRRDQDGNVGQAGKALHRPARTDGLTALARLAGYDARELLGLPGDALRSASGCGTPVAVSDLLPGEAALVVGPGADVDLILTASRVGPVGRVIGIAWDEVSIGRIRSNVGAAGFDNVEIRRGQRDGLPVADGAVDWVIGNRMIGICPGKVRVFVEIHRVLKPGGRVCWADLVAEGLPAWVRSDPCPAVAWLASALGESEYLSGLAEAGLEDVRDGGRYVYSTAELAAVAESMGDAADVASVAARLADDVVGGVWRAYFFARKPLLKAEDGRVEEKEESR